MRVSRRDRNKLQRLRPALGEHRCGGEVIISFLFRPLALFSRLLDALFDPQEERGLRWLSWLWLIGLVLAGAALWGKFLNWGNIPFDFHDWAEVNAPRLAFLRDAVLKGVLPLHMPDASALRNITERYLALPDVLISPQIILLRWLEVGQFILVNTWLFYALGVLGLLWLRRRFGLSLAAYTILFLLFNFNGHILAHYSIGHITWAGYFLFPLFAALIVQLLDGDHSWAWAARISLLLFFMYLQGSFHQYIWAMIFLGLLAATSWKHLLPILKAGIFAVLLAMARLLPPTLHLGEFDSEFLGGYPTLFDVFNSMLSIKFPHESLNVRNMLSPLGWWEYDLYLGAAGAAFLLAFGVYGWLKRRETLYPQLFLPIWGMVLLSIGRFYRLMRLLPVPIFSGERASIRMIILPLVFLLILGTVQFQHWLNRRKPSPAEKIAWLGAILLILHDLWQHLKAWQVTEAFAAFPTTPVNLAIKVVANHPDPPYITLLAMGAGVSAVSLVLLLGLVWRENRLNKKG